MMKLLVSILFVVLFFRLTLAGQCMSGEGILKAFVVKGTCYWIIGPANYTDWNSAAEACEQHYGSLAIITTEEKNDLIANRLDRPVFIGYHKLMNGSWSWINDTYDYVKPYTDTGGVHMALIDDTGEWETTYMDAKRHLYDVMCSVDRDPFLRCSKIQVPFSTKTRGMPMYSGDTIKFTCLDGYHVTVGITVQILSCLPPNIWSFPARDCKPIECDLIDPPAYTTRDSESQRVGDSVVYTCTNDTWFFPAVDAMVFECTGSGEWVPSLRPCGFLRCEPPPSLIMGTLDTTVTLYRHQITYTCLTGYEFSDGVNSKTISCEGDPPEWVFPGANDTLLCVQIFCPDPPSAGTGAWSHGSQPLSVGYYQVWWCWEGFTHPSGEVGTTAVCEKSTNPAVANAWAKSIPHCEPLGCAEMTVENATRVNNTGFIVQEIYPTGYTVSYVCDDENSKFPGGVQRVDIECLRDGQWDSEVPLSGCDASRCEEGWLAFEDSCYFISNGRSLGLRYEYAEESCNYKHSNLIQITSDKEASWVATVTYDVYERDFWIGYHQNYSGEWVWKGEQFVSNYTNFAEGYPEFYSCARTTVRGFWKDRNCDELMPYICKKTSICGPSPTITNGAALDLPEFPVNVGEKITYVCDDGFRFKEGGLNVTIECEFGGFWTKITNCVVDLCPPVNTADTEIHGAWYDTTLNEVGDVITYTCQDGTLFPDGSRFIEMECLSGGTWSVEPEECEELRCPKPASPDTTPRHGYDEWGQMDYYRCDEGYSFADAEIDKLFWCTRDGTWLPTGQSCIPRACPKYSVAYGTVTPDEGVYGDEIVAECYRGYTFPDTSTRKVLTCTSDGVWSQDPAACFVTKCPGPKPPDVEGAYRDTDVIKSGTEVNYTCLYETVYINGDKSRIAYCDYETLQWQNLPTPCVDAPVVIKTEHSHPAVEAKNAVTYGMVVGLGTIITLLVCVLGLDGATIGRFVSCGKGAEEADLEKLYDVKANSMRPPTTIHAKRADHGNELKQDEIEEGEETGSEYETDDEDEDLPTYQL